MSLMILRMTDIVFCMFFLFMASGFSQTADRFSMTEWNKALEARPGQQPNQIMFASAMKQGSLLMAKDRYQEAIFAFTEAIGQNFGSNEATCIVICSRKSVLTKMAFSTIFHPGRQASARPPCWRLTQPQFRPTPKTSRNHGEASTRMAAGCKQ